MRDLPQPPQMSPDGKLPGKLVVVENVYHIRHDTEPTAVESRYSRWLGSYGPAHSDEFEATDEWQPVQSGRVKECGLMTIENLAGADLQVVPTPEERARIATLVLEVGFIPIGGRELAADDRGEIIVLPGETARFQAAPHARVYLRCRARGERAGARVTTIPT